MAFVATTLTADTGRSFSIGPIKVQIMSWAAASADTSGTATFDKLSRVDTCILVGLTQTALPTLSGNVATLAFADPAATVVGYVIGIGR